LKKIRKSAARNEEFGSASLDLPQGAHLKTKSVKVFGPKFDDETGEGTPISETSTRKSKLSYLMRITGRLVPRRRPITSI
jgi:hypothetical protein